MLLTFFFAMFQQRTAKDLRDLRSLRKSLNSYDSAKDALSDPFFSELWVWSCVMDFLKMKNKKRMEGIEEMTELTPVNFSYKIWAESIYSFCSSLMKKSEFSCVILPWTLIFREWNVFLFLLLSFLKRAYIFSLLLNTVTSISSLFFITWSTLLQPSLKPSSKSCLNVPHGVCVWWRGWGFVWWENH